MPDRYYSDNLYPLQDRILELTALRSSIFYLTGGTLLGRHYCHHRYSDDLDFFCNSHGGFQKETERIIAQLTRILKVDLESTGSTYALLFVTENDITMKIDFVNDVPYRVGESHSTDLFPRCDNWQNILVNKLSALTRQEAKDVVDILFICRKFAFEWPLMIGHALKKDMWVNEAEVARSIGECRVDDLKKIKWINEPDYECLVREIRLIAKDVLQGGPNSLGSSAS